MVRSASSLGLFLASLLLVFVLGSPSAPGQGTKEKEKPRFIDRGEYVEDTQTGLFWQKDGVSSGKLNFYQAAEYAKSLKLGRLTGWRVPTAKELEAIFPATDKPFTNTKYNPNMCCAGGEFNSYWTSDLDKRLDDYAFIYQWYDKGGANNCTASKNFAYVRCVRGKSDTAAEADVAGTKPSEAKPLDEETLKSVQVLILLLSSDDFATREYATKELKKLTSKIVPQLEAELEKTKDPEVKARLRGLLGK